VDNFWSLFRESVIVQALLALMTTSAIIYALLQGITIPNDLWAIWGIIMGYYFGSKAQMAANGTLQRLASFQQQHKV